MASPGIEQAAVATQKNRPARVIDQVSKNNGLFYVLREKKLLKKESGGTTIVRNLEFQENSSFQYYDGAENLNVSPSEILTAAEYEWKQAAVNAQITGKEKRINKGNKTRVVNLYKSKIKNAEKTLINKLAVDCYSDGTGTSGKQIGGLQLLVADSPAVGTVGGISAATWEFWRNIAVSAATVLGVAPTSANIQRLMRKARYQITNMQTGDKPDLWLADDTFYDLYVESLTPMQITQKSDMADAGFDAVRFMGGDVVCDGGIGGGAPAGMYALCTDYLDFTVHEDADFAQLGGKREPTGQDVEMVFFGFMGNLTISKRMCQARVTA